MITLKLEGMALNTILAILESMMIRYKEESLSIESWDVRKQKTQVSLDPETMRSMVQEKEALQGELRRLRRYLQDNHPMRLTESNVNVYRRIRKEGLHNPWTGTIMVPPIKEPW